MDSATLREHHPEHAALVVPESLRQRTGTSLAQDAELLFNPWSYSVRHIHPDLAKAIHIWQGTPTHSGEGYQQARQIYAVW